MNSEVILKVTDLKTHFDVTKGMFSKKQIGQGCRRRQL